MNAHPINTSVENEERKTLESLINFMGAFDGGADSEEFKEVKKALLESGITSDQLWSLMMSNAADEIIGRETIDVQIQKLTDTAQIPTYSHITDACADIYADEDIVIKPGETYPVSTGLALAVPDGYVVHVYARSGLSLKSGIRLANSVGIIDAGYRDELKILLWNSSQEDFHVEKGMRIAQMDILPSPGMDFIEIEDIKTVPGDRFGGFGSTGMFETINSFIENESMVAELNSFNGEI